MLPSSLALLVLAVVSQNYCVQVVKAIIHLLQQSSWYNRSGPLTAGDTLPCLSIDYWVSIDRTFYFIPDRFLIFKLLFRAEISQTTKILIGQFLLLFVSKYTLIHCMYWFHGLSGPRRCLVDYSSIVVRLKWQWKLQKLSALHLGLALTDLYGRMSHADDMRTHVSIADGYLPRLYHLKWHTLRCRAWWVVMHAQCCATSQAQIGKKNEREGREREAQREKWL